MRDTGHLADVVARLAAASDASAVGLGVLARTAPASAEGQLASDLAEELRGVVSTARFVGHALGLPDGGPARRATCERLRWEWVASIGVLLDGDPRVRLAAECSSALERAAAASCRLAALVAASNAVGYVHAAAHLERRILSVRARLEDARSGFAASGPSRTGVLAS
jgi:hypothetical protein